MTSQVLDKLKATAAHYDELTRLVSDPAVQADPPTYRTHSKALADLQETVDRYHEYDAVERQLAEAREVAASGDPELRELAAEEIAALEARLIDLDIILRGLLVPRDPNDDRDVVLEIRAGTGGDEAALFASDLFRMYTRYAERQRWKVDVLSASEGTAGGYKEIIAEIAGRGAFARLKYESGVHRVQRVPATEAQGRIHTSAATVAVLAEADEVDVKINEVDLKIDTYRSSGAGGQHVNTTDSAVRITHVPTGVIVACQEERSQIKNRAKAMKMLRSKILEAEQQRQAQAEAAARKSQVGSGDRSEKIRTYNFPQDRVTDHRIGLTKHNLPGIIDGNIDEIVDALRANAQAEALKESGL